jgi:hypothetical protein
MSSVTVLWYYYSVLLPPFFPTLLLAGLETVVVPLPDNLLFPKLQRHGKNGLHLPQPDGSKGYSQSSDPLNFQRHPVVVSYLLLYLIHLAGHDLFAPFRPLQSPQSGLAFCRRASAGVGIPPRLRREQKTYGVLLPSLPFDSLQESPRDLRIAGQFGHFCLPARRLSGPVQFLAPGRPPLVSRPGILFNFFGAWKTFAWPLSPLSFPTTLRVAADSPGLFPPSIPNVGVAR